MRHAIYLIIVIFLCACSKNKTPIEKYVERTNKQCPIPLYPNSKSQFLGISLSDSTILFTYNIHESEAYWNEDSIQQAQSLRKDIEKMLASKQFEMQELLDHLLQSKLATKFLYTNSADSERKILITFSHEELLQLKDAYSTIATDDKSQLQYILDSLSNSTPIILEEGASIESLKLNTAADTFLHLHIQLQEEPFMALRAMSSKDRLQQHHELIQSLQNTSHLAPLLSYIKHYHIPTYTTYSGITSKDTVNIMFK